MVWLTLFVGVLNLCLGYAVAVCLGFAPPGAKAAWEALSVGSSAPAGPKVSTAQMMEELVATPLEQMLDDDPDDDMEDTLSVEAYEESDEDDESGQVDVDGPEMWNLNEKYIETSINKLNIAMMKSGKRSTEIDTRLRACRGATDVETVQKSLAELKEDCETYLGEQSELAEKFSERISELGELSELGDEIEMANLEQSAQVETTLSNLSNMDFESDLEEANTRLLEEIANLRTARHKLRDNQEQAFLAIARSEDRVENIESQLFNDPLTKLYNRIGLEATLWKWWKEKRNQTRQINVALFDIDGMGLINEKHGSLVGDRILYQAAQFIRV